MASLFEHAENHITVVRSLSSRLKGLTRQEIIKLTGITNGGGLTKTLDELVHSNFISEYFPFYNKLLSFFLHNFF